MRGRSSGNRKELGNGRILEPRGPDDPTNSFRHAGSNKPTYDGVRIYLGGPDWEGDMVLTYKLNPSPLCAHSAGGAAVWREG